MRRGRIIRMGSACAILIVLLYALLKWSGENVVSETPSELISDAHAEYYKFHPNVYPILKTGNNILLTFIS